MDIGDILPFMDPKSIANLDPKLQETYARVMGTHTPPTFGDANTPPTDTAKPTDDGLSSPVGTSSTPVTPTPMSENAFPSQQPIPATNVSQTASPFTAPLQSPQPLTPPAAMVPHETSTGLKIAYIVGAVIFFAVYTIFWIKIFNLPFIF